MSGIALGVVAFLLVAGAMALWAQRIKRVQIPTDRRGFVACWVGGAALGPLIVGVVLDASGGAQDISSWGLAFASVGLVAVIGPGLLLTLTKPRFAASPDR